MATIKDIARKAGVSVATVSYVLNGSKSLSPAVEERVMDAAKTLNYRRNRSAHALRTGQSHKLGLILPDLLNPYFPELAQAVAVEARASGFTLLLIDTTNDLATELEGLQLLAEHRVDGAIWVPATSHQPEPPPFPVVIVDRPIDSFPTVLADHHQGGELIARYAISHGHQHIGLLSGPQSLTSARLRREGFLAAANGLDIVWEHEVPFSLTLPNKAVRSLKEQTATLVVAASDVVAIGALRTLQEAGIRVPQDVSVIGYDDIPWAALVSPPLTTVRQPVAAMGKTAVTKLKQFILKPDAAIKQDLLPVTLVERASVQAR